MKKSLNFGIITKNEVFMVLLILGIKDDFQSQTSKHASKSLELER